MTLQERIAQARANLTTAEGQLTEADQEEIRARAELEAVEAKIQEAKRAARDLDVARRLDAAREKYGEVKAVIVKGFSDTFIVRRNGKAYSTWSDQLAASASGKNVDKAQASRSFAAKCVVDWNGKTELDGDSALNLFLVNNPGVVVPLTDAAAELAGVYAEDLKS